MLEAQRKLQSMSEFGFLYISILFKDFIKIIER